MYQGPVIDCDVHHARHDDAELLAYVSPGWREYITDRGPAGNVPLTVQDGLPNPHGFMRADTYPPTGGPAGSDFATEAAGGFAESAWVHARPYISAARWSRRFGFCHDAPATSRSRGYSPGD